MDADNNTDAMHHAPLIKQYHQIEDYFFRRISLKCLNLEDDAHAYMTGDAGLNFIYLTKNPSALDKILIKGKQFYDHEHHDFEIIIPQKYCTTPIKDSLMTLGCRQTSSSVAMHINLATTAQSSPALDNKEITIKANDKQLNEWMLPLIGAFESSLEVCLVYAKTHEQALKNNIKLYHFSVYKQEKPISSLTLSVLNELARIDDVGTTPEFQGQGYATALMRHALVRAKDLGAQHCFLESSESGFGVYQKLGFEALFKNQIYSKPQFKLSFKNLQENNLEQLCLWLDKPHVKEWWNDGLSHGAIQEKYRNRIADESIVPFIVYFEENPIGFIQYYHANKVGDGWWPEEIEGTLGLDQFIGEDQYLGRGYGTQMLLEFIKILFDKPGIKKIIMDVDPNNQRAINCYKKAGFKCTKKLMTPDGLAMVMEIKKEETNTNRWPLNF